MEYVVCFRVKQYLGLHEEKIYFTTTAEDVRQVVTNIKNRHLNVIIDYIFPIKANLYLPA